jgi:hypothetical protein
MSVQVNTQGTTAILSRASTLNYNSAYTVLFRWYSTGSHSSDVIWAISESTGTGGGLYPSLANQDRLRFSSGGDLWLAVFLSSTPYELTGVSLGAGWHEVAVVRSSATSIKLRINGTNYTGSTVDVGSRASVAYEFAVGTAYDGAECPPAGSRMTNYKSWSAALTDGEIDAEHDSTTFTVTTGKYSGSPMGDAATLSNNLSADGSGTTWTAGAGLIAGANDPGVSYGTSFIPRRMMLGVG